MFFLLVVIHTQHHYTNILKIKFVNARRLMIK
jgi:hypothetical protein